MSRAFIGSLPGGFTTFLGPLGPATVDGGGGCGGC